MPSLNQERKHSTITQRLPFCEKSHNMQVNWVKGGTRGILDPPLIYNILLIVMLKKVM